MAMIARRDGAALALAGAFALGMPLVLLKGAAKMPEPPRNRPPLNVAQRPPLAAAYDRALFAVASESDSALPGDAPALIGIVGRLGADAVALVRGSEGATRALRQGDSVDGWTLASLAIDAAFFTRGAQRVRVPLPAGDDAQ